MYFDDHENHGNKNTSNMIRGLLNRALMFALGFALTATPVVADSINTTGEVLKINPDPITSAMGGGILSRDYSPGSIFVNPASPAQFFQPRFSFSGTRLAEDINYQFTGIVVPTGIGNFTAAAGLLSYGDIQGYYSSGVPYNISSSQDELFALNYSLPLKKLL